ncbi:biorientation of chromosomes in cell division protein 1-like 1 [Gigantopelta aegis]|uniref:biorientation of chromosomes in cell division protein 1-like 1 n=1 Tax=Gigantopelta aegis TaxID=1735272 RepID=UPI001B88DD97|nr:biorientation of chromosomes in cell division protein 1-like 1 [Gigantopelta aegis]
MAAHRLVLLLYGSLAETGKPKKKRANKSCKRTVSFPPMFPTIIEKVEEEERAAKETAKLPPSPLTELYDGLTLKQRHTWPRFLGDWAFVDGVPNRGGSTGSDDGIEYIDLDAIDNDDVFAVDAKPSDVHPLFFLDVDDKPSEAKDVKQTTQSKQEQNNNQSDKAEPKPILVKKSSQPDNKTADNKENTKDNGNLKDPAKTQSNSVVSDSRGKASPGPKGILKKTKEEEPKQSNLSKTPKADDNSQSKKDDVVNIKQDSVVKPKESDKRENDKKGSERKSITGETKDMSANTPPVPEKIGDLGKVELKPVQMAGKKEATSAQDGGSVKTGGKQKIVEGDSKESAVNKNLPGKTGDVETAKVKPVKVAEKKENTPALDVGSTKTKPTGKTSPSVDKKDAGKPGDIEKVKLKAVKSVEKKDDISATDTGKTKVKESGKLSLKSEKTTEVKEDATTNGVKNEKASEKIKLKPVTPTTKEEKTLTDAGGEKRNGVEKVKLKSASSAKKKDDITQVKTQQQKAVEKVSPKSTKPLGNTEVKGNDAVKPDNFKNVKLHSVKKVEKGRDASPEVITKQKEFEKVSLKSVETKPEKIQVKTRNLESKPEEIKKLKLKSVNGGEKKTTDKINSVNAVESKSIEIKNIKLKSTKTTSVKPLEAKSEVKSEIKTKVKLIPVSNDAHTAGDTKQKPGASTLQSRDITNDDTSRVKHRRASEPRINKIDFMKQMFESRVEKGWRSRSAERPRTSATTTEKQNLSRDEPIISQHLGDAITSQILHETKNIKSWVQAKIIIEGETTPQPKKSCEKEARSSPSPTVGEVRTTATSRKQETITKQSESKQSTSKHEVGLKTKVEKTTAVQKDSNKSSAKQKETHEKITQITTKQNTTVRKETVTREVIQTTTKAKCVVDQRAVTGTTIMERQNVSLGREVTKSKQKEEMKTSLQKQVTMTTKNTEEHTTVSRGGHSNVQSSQMMKQTVKTHQQNHKNNGEDRPVSTVLLQVHEVRHSTIVGEQNTAQKSEPELHPRTVKPSPGQEYLNIRKAILKNANFEMGDETVTTEGAVTPTSQYPGVTDTSSCSNRRKPASDGLSGLVPERSERVQSEDDHDRSFSVNNASCDYNKTIAKAEGKLISSDKCCKRSPDTSNEGAKLVSSDKCLKRSPNTCNDKTKVVSSDTCIRGSSDSANGSLPKTSIHLSMQNPKETRLTRSQIFHLLESRQSVNLGSDETSENVHACSTRGGKYAGVQNGDVRTDGNRWDDNPIKTEIKNKINEQIELRNSPKTSRKHKISSKAKVSSGQTKLIESSQPNIRSPITFSFSNSVARRHGSTSPQSRVDVPVVESGESIRSRLELFPFRRKFEFEDVAFLLCMLTFSALMTGMPSMSFVLLVITVELLYVLVFCCWT